MYWMCVFVIIFFIVFMLGYCLFGFISGKGFDYMLWGEDDRGNLVIGSVSISILVMLLYGVSL